MAPASKRTKNNNELATLSGQHQSSPNISAVPSSASPAPAFSTIREHISGMMLRNAISVVSGETAQASSAEAATTSSENRMMADGTLVSSPAKSSHFPESNDAIMVNAEAVPASSPVRQTNRLASSEPAQASGTLMAPRNFLPPTTRVNTFGGLKSKTAGAQPVEHENNFSLKPKEKGKERETGSEKRQGTGNTILFHNLSCSSHAELMQPEDLSRYVVDAPPLPGQADAPESSSSRDKGKGRATDAPSLLSTHQIEALTTPGTKKAPNTYAAKKIQSSVERRLANYAVTHPPGWFNDLPPINEDLFKDSPHKEYKMVLIHTARCNVCLQYNKGTLFMCADCTVSICESCAETKCGVEDDDVVIGEAGEDADKAARKLNWCGAYHEVFRVAYLEWKAADGGKEGFVSTEGVEFKTSTGKQGGRKRKATA